MMLLGLGVYPICLSIIACLIQIGTMVEEQEGSHGVVTKWCLHQLRVLYAMRIWISQTRAFYLACTGSDFAFFARKGFLRRMAAVLDAGSHMKLTLLRQRQVFMGACCSLSPLLCLVAECLQWVENSFLIW